MTIAQWTRISTDAFTVALVAYMVAMVGYFFYLAFRREQVWRAASAIAWFGLITQIVSIVARGFAAGRMPWGNMYEFTSLTSMLVVLGYLVIVERRYGAKTLGGFALAFSVLTMLIAVLFLYVGPGPLLPSLNNYMRNIHVTAIIFAFSLLALGSGVLTPLFLYKEWRERTGAEQPPGPGEPKPIMGGSVDVDPGQAVEEPPHFAAGADEPVGATSRRGLLPPSATLDRLAYRMIAFGFPIWTFAVIAGAVWAQSAWGRYWGWDPKETWAFITWVVFAGYLHARATAGWKGRRAAVIALIGFACLLVTYYAVNLWIGGLHSTYANA